MNNLTQTQIGLMALVRQDPSSHNNCPITACYIGVQDIGELEALAPACDTLIAFSPELFVREQIQDLVLHEPKVVFSDRIVPTNCVMLIVDAHEDGIQSDAEITILKAFTPNILETKPHLFIRAEDPHQAFRLVNYLDETLNYDAFYLLEVAGEKNEAVAIWLFGAARGFGFAENPGWGDFDAHVSGHPRLPNQVEDSIVTYKFMEH